MPLPLEHLRVVDFSTGIPGAYTTKLLADAGADVWKVEPAGGDPLRRWSASGLREPDADGLLFRFLAAGKSASRGTPQDAVVRERLARADLVVDSFAAAEFDPSPWLDEFPHLVWLSITPFGRSGPARDRVATEFTIQAASGSLATRGLPGGEPFQAGGRVSEWFAGSVGAVAALAALRRRERGGEGEHIDLSLHEAMLIAGTSYSTVLWQMLGDPDPPGPAQSIETPSIEPTRDGWVGFCTNSRQQFADFLTLIGRPDLEDQADLQQVRGREARLAEWQGIVRAFTESATTAEVMERAALLRIPAAPVNDGRSVLEHEQLAARGVYRALSGTRARAPRPPYRIDGRDIPAPAPLAEGQAPRWRERADAAGSAAAGRDGIGRPLEGIRILDMTAWWAGPSATQILASFGAEVIHVESAARPDGMRMIGGMLAGNFEQWWEASPFFQAANAGKKGLTLDLSDPRGRAALLRLVAQVDAVVENFTPRVLEGFGLGREQVFAANPGAIFLRMPAFGLDGPWRDHPGFAQTMEQLSGLAWVTGHEDDQPRIQRGPCDPLAGMHAAFAFFLALRERAERGRGVFVESTMVEAALNAASEIALEASANGVVLGRMGNRALSAAPQGLYACADGTPAAPAWLALSIETDVQWVALLEALGWEPASVPEAWQGGLAARLAAHDAIDARLREAFASAQRGDIVARLQAVGVPAEELADPRRTHDQPHLLARRFLEAVDHPVTGRALVPGQAFRFASFDRKGQGWLAHAAPTLGEHSREVLSGVGGLAPEEIDALEQAGVTGADLRRG